VTACSYKFNGSKTNVYNQKINQDISRTLILYDNGTYNFRQAAKLASYNSQGSWTKTGNRLLLNT